MLATDVQSTSNAAPDFYWCFSVVCSRKYCSSKTVMASLRKSQRNGYYLLGRSALTDPKP